MLTKSFLPKQIIFFLINIYFFISGLVYCADDSFYIFSVGQGNSQFCVYSTPKGNLGILYDSGSSSTQIHYKFDYDPTSFVKFLAHNEGIVDESDSEHSQAGSTSSDSVGKPIKQQTRMTVGNTTDKTSRALKHSYVTTIQETIKQKNLIHLFIFLSHPDEDHINYLNENIIPTSLRITVILGGGWLSESNKSKDNLKEDVINVLEFLSTRDNTIYEIPYYGQSPNYGSIKSNIKNKEFIDLWCNFGENKSFLVDPSFIGNIKTLLEYLKIPTTHFNYEDQEFKDFLESVFIWSLNNIAEDVNDQSIVMSCTNRSLNMSIILTGDAGNTVFQKIAYEYTKYKKLHFFTDTTDVLRKTIPNLDEDHMILLMVPHHGSERNKSNIMLELFYPNFFGISAGNGGRYDHPSFQTIKDIIRWNNNDDLHKNLKAKLWNKYSKLVPTFCFLAFENTIPIVIQEKEKRPLFLTTNIHGCVKIDKNGIFQQFLSQFQYNKNTYITSMESHIAKSVNKMENTFVLLNNLELNNDNILSTDEALKNTKFCVKFIDNGKNIFVSEDEKNALWPVTIDSKTYYYIARNLASDESLLEERKRQRDQ